MKRGRTAVKGNGTVGLTEGRKEGRVKGRKGERKDYQLSVQSPAGFVIGGQSKKKNKQEEEEKMALCLLPVSPHHCILSAPLSSAGPPGCFPPYNKVS